MWLVKLYNVMYIRLDQNDSDLTNFAKESFYTSINYFNQYLHLLFNKSKTTFCSLFFYRRNLTIHFNGLQTELCNVFYIILNSGKSGNVPISFFFIY